MATTATKAKTATAAVKATKGTDATAGAADRDAVFGRFILTLGQVMRGVQLLLSDPEFRPITLLSDDLTSVLGHLDGRMVAAYEPLLTAYAATRETVGGAAAG